MNIRVFIDSDSDVRLSRKIYKDTVENGKLLDVSILEYLTQIKPSYEK
jgi:uridine kinase